MKLKKIASLALAGVMAVSMLAGCATNKPEEKPGEGEGEGATTTTGYSAQLEDFVELTDAEAKYISFADNAADQTALEAAVKGLSYPTLEAYSNSNWVIPADVSASAQSYSDMKEMLANFKEDAKLYGDVAIGTLSLAALATDELNQNVDGMRGGAVFAVNGAVDVTNALKSIAGKVRDTAINNLPKDNSEATNNGSSYEYSYVISVSAVNKAQTAAYNDTAASTTLIAVTVTRTVTEG